MALEEIIFPNNIREIRIASKIKMTELAKKVGLSLSAISKIEKGVRRVNQEQLLKISNILNCKLSDIFIHSSDEMADIWKNEIKRRLKNNENNGLKVFGIAIRNIRESLDKTIAETAKDAKMTLSVYHKLEKGQREIYKDELEPLAKAFKLTSKELFDKVANLYKSGAISKQIEKTQEKNKSLLEPKESKSSVNSKDSLYATTLYDNARSKLVPVFGNPNDETIIFQKSDSKLILSDFKNSNNMYAVIPNVKRTHNFLPKNSIVFIDITKKAEIGDLALFIEDDFIKMKPEDLSSAQIAVLKKDLNGFYGNIFSPDEKVRGKTIHKIVSITMK